MRRPEAPSDVIEKEPHWVDGDTNSQEITPPAAIHLGVAQISKNQVAIGATGQHIHAGGLIRGGETLIRICALDGAGLTLGELLGAGDLQGGGLGGNRA